MNTNKPVHAITHPLLNGGSLAHGFFTREGGVSNGIYSGLNCGSGSDDNPENVKTNRKKAMDALGTKTLLTCYQFHSADVITINEKENWQEIFAPTPPKADAMVSKQTGIALGILTADCAPVLLADKQNGVIGALHAGWKGAVSGIVRNTVNAMIELGANPATTAAVVGPTIQQQSYEVGADVRDAVIKNINSGGERFFVPSIKSGHWMFDLPAFVVAQLQNSDINKIESTGLDTYSDEKNFFSYRRTTHRGEKDYGRILSAIMLSN